MNEYDELLKAKSAFEALSKLLKENGFELEFQWDEGDGNTICMTYKGERYSFYVKDFFNYLKNTKNIDGELKYIRDFEQFRKKLRYKILFGDTSALRLGKMNKDLMGEWYPYELKYNPLGE